MIDILIPTYNRSGSLIKNIKYIDYLVEKEGLEGCFQIIISNNASTDDTEEELKKVKLSSDIPLVLYNQKENIGLEKNVVFTLENSRSEYVIFLGDDDYLPSGYLTKLYEVYLSKKAGVVIPGFSALDLDGTIHTGRSDFDSRANNSGYEALLDFSSFGHQLSGLFFKRSGVVEAYKADEKNRNIYPFIFFIGFVMKDEASLYLPEFQVLVTQGNSKDWKYDASGLLTEIFKNFNSLCPNDRFKKIKLCIEIMKRQSWRMRIGKNPLLAISSLLHLMQSGTVDPALKLMLPIIYPYIYLKKISFFIKRKLFK